jgi:hypothetical protein
MSTPTRGEWSEGCFERVGRALPVREIDASGWEPDIPTGDENSAFLRSVAQAVPSIARNSVGSDDDPPVWLELRVSFAEDTAPAKVIEHTNRLIGLLSAADPELGLTWDHRRSRAEDRDVIVALSPRSMVAGAEKRLRDLLAIVEPDVGRLSGTNRTVARLVRPDAA